MTERGSSQQGTVLAVVSASGSSVTLAFDITKMCNESSQTNGETREGTSFTTYQRQRMSMTCRPGLSATFNLWKCRMRQSRLVRTMSKIATSDSVPYFLHLDSMPLYSINGCLCDNRPIRCMTAIEHRMMTVAIAWARAPINIWRG